MTTNVAAPNSVEQLVPVGTLPPDDIFQATLATLVAGRRLDMGQLAAELGISRTTIYRKVGDRDRLLGDVVWYLMRRALVPVLDSVRDLRGADRVTQGVLRFLSGVREPQPAMARLLEEEPSAALRVLASKEGVIQGHLIELTRRVIVEERERGELPEVGDPTLVATAIIRLSESFLYGHLISREELDLDLLARMIHHVLEGGAG